jgi:hypothetical protein
MATLRSAAMRSTYKQSNHKKPTSIWEATSRSATQRPSQHITESECSMSWTQNSSTLNSRRRDEISAINYLTYGPKNKLLLYIVRHSVGRIVGLGTILQVGRLQLRFQMKSLDFSIDLNRTVALWPHYWLSHYQVSSWGERRPARKAGNFTAMCKPIFYQILDPQRLATLRTSTIRLRGSFTFYLYTTLLYNCEHNLDEWYIVRL